jgi:hypothetical protein
MAMVDPDHLFEQADRIDHAITDRTRGSPNRPPTSGVGSVLRHIPFHDDGRDRHICRNGKPGERTIRFPYRTVKHDWLSNLCDHLRGLLRAKAPPHAPGADFFGPLVKFATSVATLQEKRHSADYDPLFSVR